MIDVRIATPAGWVEWHGSAGDCPLPPETIIKVRFRNGEETAKPDSAKSWYWGHHQVDSDIVAYIVFDVATAVEAVQAVLDFHRNFYAGEQKQRVLWAGYEFAKALRAHFGLSIAVQDPE